jgi:hypothetical protein
MTFCILFFNETFRILGIDKNIFMIPFVSIFIIYAINICYASLLLVLLVLVSQSRLPIYIFILTFLANYFFKGIRNNSLNNFLAITLGISIFSGILSLIGFFENQISTSRGIFDIIDQSNLERLFALKNAINYLIDYPLILSFGGGWCDYISFVTTRVHNDFFQITIKYGIFGLFLFINSISNIFTKLYIPFAAIFALSFFSSLLGGVGWLTGLYWLLAIIILFNNYSIGNRIE